MLRSTSQVARPERLADLSRLVLQGATPVLVRGNGRSYGDAALNGGGQVVLTTRLDRMLALDPEAATVTVEAGVTFGDLVRSLVPHGFLPAVVPGTGLATVGGGIANDVHGKNHHLEGSLGQQLAWLDLRTPDGVLHHLLGDDDSDLFRATLGGVGLTGVIERACLKLRRVPSGAVQVRSERMTGLDHFLQRLQEEQDRTPYVVGWIDALASGSQLGRGILELATPSDDGEALPAPPRVRRVPFDFPGFALNAWSVRLFNELYFRRIPAGGRTDRLPYPKFLFPLDALHDWNRIYGRRGFHQFQCVVPFDSAPVALREMLQTIAASGLGSFLAVLKALGSAGRGFLSFPQPGFTLALDFPDGPRTRPLIDRLEAMACAHGGRTYLAKDSTLRPDRLAAMYPHLESYREVLARIDPQGRMGSDLGRRLGLSGGGIA
ncbi:MAG: FAD-binding oxidoreductase [Burkholderiaceae bacterium]